jgi:hypothetical protein
MIEQKSTNFNQATDIVLFFCPEAAVVPHYAVLCILAKNLEMQGYKSVLTFCPALFNRCPVMDMSLMGYESASDNQCQVCEQCASCALNMLQKYELNVIDLKTYLPANAHTVASTSLSSVQPKDAMNFCFADLPIGRLAFGDYAIAHKAWPSEDELDEKFLQSWQAYAHANIVTHLVIDNLCRQLPIKRIVSYNDYSNNMTARLTVERHGGKAFTVSHASHKGGVDLQKITLISKPGGVTLKEEIKNWHLWRDLPITGQLVEDITTDIIERFAANNVFTFSPAKTISSNDIREQLGLSKVKQTLVAYTSSADELVFLNNLVTAYGEEHQDKSGTFPDQITWLKCLIDFVENSLDLQLVVRIHPREGYDKRYCKPSRHLFQLKETFSEAYKHTLIIWPDDPISSYDLAEIADAGLTSWSTISIELARLGIPTITAFPDITFPCDDYFLWGGPTKEDYFETILKALKTPPTLDAIALAFRSYHVYRMGSSIVLDDVIPNHTYREAPPFIPLVREATKIKRALIDLDDVRNQNRDSLVYPYYGTSLTEYETIKKSLKRVLWFLFMGQDLTENIFISTDPATHTSNGANFSIETDRSVHFKYLTTESMRYSPLAHRLISIINDSVHAGYSEKYSGTKDAQHLLI